MKEPKQPTQGGSYVYDPKKDELKQVEKPTVHVDLNEKLKAAAEAKTPEQQTDGSAGKGN